MRSKNNARQASATILEKWQRLRPTTRPPLSKICSQFLDKMHIEGLDRSLAAELCFGTVRWKRLLDWHLNRHLTSPIKKLPVFVQCVLESGLYQIFFLDRVPVSAAVNEAVNTVRVKYPWAKGLTNAVLRRLSKLKGDHTSIFNPAGLNNEDIASNIGIVTSHPNWMVKRWIECRGVDATRELCIANNQRPPLTLRVNSLKTTRENMLDALSRQGIAAIPGQLSPHAVIITESSGNPAELPGYDEGWFQVQDEAAQVVADCISPKPEMKILDVCAGVGGKTTHIAQLAEDKAEIIAIDKDAGRLKKLQENASRLDIKGIKIFTSQEFDHISDNYALFDRILIDAPCSGLGVIRRHPDIKWNRQPEDISFLASIQLKLLAKYAPMLKPGGLLVYSTCTLEPEETSGVAEKFLESDESNNIKKILETNPDILTNSIDQKQYPMPDHFFIAVFKKGL